MTDSTLGQKQGFEVNKGLGIESNKFSWVNVIGLAFIHLTIIGVIFYSLEAFSNTKSETNEYEKVVSGVWKIDSTGETAVIDFLGLEKYIKISDDKLAVEIIELDIEQAIFKLNVQGMAEVWLLQATQNEEGGVNLFLYINEDTQSKLTFVGELGDLMSDKQNLNHKEMSLDDLRLDLEELVGESVKVKAIGMYLSEVFMLQSSQTDANPLVAEIGNLSREQRKQILKKCSNFVEGCILTVTGNIVLNSFDEPTLDITRIEVE